MEEKYTSQGVEYIANVEKDDDYATIVICKSGSTEPVYSIEAGDESIAVNGSNWDLQNILYYSFSEDKNVLYIVASVSHEYDEFSGDLSVIETVDDVISYNIPCNKSVEAIIEEYSGM